MSDGGTDWEDEEESPGRPFGPKPFGPKPFGPKPFGPKPFGPKSFGLRPFGPKPFGPKPFGPKPFAAGDADAGFLDLQAWGADIAELVCERSAVIRLGATLIASEHGRSLPVPVFDVEAAFVAAGIADPKPKKVSGVPADIRPGEWRLSAPLAVSPRVMQAAAGSNELTYALKAHLADALARRADKVFLQGTGSGEPKGIAGHVSASPSGKGPLETARALVTGIRSTPQSFRNPGWILAPEMLNELTTLVSADGMQAGGTGARTLDSHGLLRLDGVDGGVFLGFPFLSSAAAEPNMYFAADWQEAWIGLEESFVSVSAEPTSGDEVVVRASMPLDFALRTTVGFGFSA